MGMALRGVTHCYRCGTTLADDEFCICKNCERIKKEEEEEEKEMMFLELDLLEEEEENFSKVNKDIKKILRKIVQEELNKREKEDDKKDYEIKRLGRLTLNYHSFAERKANEDEIEICVWDRNWNGKWIVASFKYNEKTNSYDLIGNENLKRVKDWIAFGTLVKEGFEILDDFID